MIPVTDQKLSRLNDVLPENKNMFGRGFCGRLVCLGGGNESLALKAKLERIDGVEIFITCMTVTLRSAAAAPLMCGYASMATSNHQDIVM